MKHRLFPLILAVSLIVIIVAGSAGTYWLKNHLPSKKLVDKQQYFGGSDNQVTLFLNGEKQEIFGLYQNQQTYIPIEWINEHLNERFYWDHNERLLVYTLPETIVYADAKTIGATGKPLLIIDQEEVYLASGLVLTYTDVQLDFFDTGDLKRIYINNELQDRTYAQLRRTEKSRLESDIHAPIMSELEKGQQVVVVEERESWSKVLSPDGYLGYVRNKALEQHQVTRTESSFQAPVYSSISMDKKVCMAFHQVLSEEANKTFERMTAETKGLNVIAPTWFFLTDNQGNYDSIASKEYVEKAHSKGLQVWAVLDNFNRGDQVRSEILFSKTSVRQTLIENLIKDLKEYQIDGINIDIEGIKPEAGPHYVQFLRELSVSCRKEQIVLSIDNYVPTASSAFYNRAEQGRIADYVVIMGYDEHYAGGEPGSVASIGYVRKGIEDTLAVVPKEKIINAVPFYTRVWIEEGDSTKSEALGIVQAMKWVEENKIEIYWQEELGQYYGELGQGDRRKYTWLEEERSLRKKAELVKEYDLAGISCWKLGFEPAAIWDIMDINKN